MFRFKQFSVLNSGSAFKVGTDAVLLGSAATVLGTERRILDAGTGTGIITLMIAQRLAATGLADFEICGIDINAEGIEETTKNFASSPWAKHMKAKCLAIEELDRDLTAEYELIVSNPPYFENSLLNPDERKRAARHTAENGLSWRSLLDFASRHLAQDGRLAMILPAEAAEKARAATDSSLYLSRILNIKTSPSKPITRVILEFSRKEGPLSEDTLIIQEAGAYTPAYKTLTREFHIFL